MTTHLSKRLEVARDAAIAAGRATLEHFLCGVDVEFKADRSPVTIADRMAEELLREHLLGYYPADGFLGEESGETPGDSGFRWIVDPIDGTKSFIHGVPLFGTLVALEDPSGEAVLGAIYLPALEEWVAAASGEGCQWNGRPASVSGIDRLDEACACFTSLEGFLDTGRQGGFEALRRGVRVVRGWGDCYGHVLVATGRAEVMVDPILADWDAAALGPIVREAGGVFTDWGGTPTHCGKSGISTNGALHQSTLELLQGGAPS